MRPIDISIAVLASARLSRLVVTDDLGKWWIKEPIDRAMDRYADTAEAEPWWWKYRSGLDCPFCVGFWLGAATLTARAVLPRKVWLAGAGALALNYAASHIGARLGDFDTDDEETR